MPDKPGHKHSSSSPEEKLAKDSPKGPHNRRKLEICADRYRLRQAPFRSRSFGTSLSEGERSTTEVRALEAMLKKKKKKS